MKELEKCEVERKEYLDGWKRAKADLVNYKKEETERMKRLIDFSVQGFVLELLPIIDDLERAFGSIPSELQDKKEVQGLLQIKSSLLDLLEKRGVERVEVLGTEFDPRLSEAVETVEEQGKEDEIVEVLEVGYKMGERIIRPAKVRVNKTKNN